jgi:carbonic anhydrase
MRLDVRKVVSRMAGHQGSRHDVAASFVVFLVAVPLSLGIAVASGAPVTAGLVAAAVGGIVVGVLGGSPLQVSGPAAGLTVIVAALVSQFGWRATCALTLAAGVLQILLGLSRVARAVLAISPTVVHAMLAGIGVTIALGQLHVLLGGRPASSPLDDLLQLPGQLVDAHETTALLGLAVVGLLLVWPRLPAPARTLPAPLVAVMVVTLVAELWQVEVTRVDLPGSPADAVRLPELPAGSWGAMAVAVLTLAAVASVESLVSAVAVDKLRASRDRARDTSRHRSSSTGVGRVGSTGVDRAGSTGVDRAGDTGRGQARGTGQAVGKAAPTARRPPTDFDRELIGQGAANAVSGLLGGLPVTGVIVRSSTNVVAGATGRASAVLHGVWVLVFWLLLGTRVVERIPMAALAGLLVVVGVQLVKPEHLRTAGTHGELPAYVATAVGVVVLGLLEGVLVGVGVSVLLLVRRVIRTQVRVEPAVAPTHWTVTARGTLTFLSVPRLSRLLAEIPAGSVVALHLVVDFLDHAVADHLVAWKHQHEATGGTVLVDDLALAPRSSPLA